MAGLGHVLVTGATGFLGGHVARGLRAQAVPVVAVGRNEARLASLKELGCAVLAQDIATPIAPASCPAFDAVVHCAALSAPFGRPAGFVAANVDGTRNIVTLAQAHGAARMVHISTPSVYFKYEDQMGVLESSSLPCPVNHYADTKAMAEQLVRAAPLPWIILRPRGIYGPGDTALLPRVLRAASKRPLPLLRGGQAAIDLTYVEDVVDAIITSLYAPSTAYGEIYNISGAQVLPVRQIVEDCCVAAGTTVRWRKMPLAVAMTAARVIEGAALRLPHQPEPVITRYGLGLFAYRQSLDVSKARKLLGWSPKVPFADGLARTFAAAP